MTILKKIIKKFLNLKFKNNQLSNLFNFIFSHIINQHRVILFKKNKINLCEVNNWTKERNLNFTENEKETLNWIENFKGSQIINFFDIGSNIGHFSIYAALTHENIQVTSFEPSFYNQLALIKNIKLNNLNKKINIVGNPISLRSKLGNLNLSSDDIGAAMNKFDSNKNQTDKNSYKLPSLSLDDFVKIYNIKPDYIKIDVDGLEKEIILGSKNLFNSHYIKEILIEIDERLDSNNQIFNFLNNNKFKFKEKHNLNIDLPIFNQLWVNDS
tara:strand:+ start:3019 stop:3828 length:810 start_codon:yes stop_codon:yes gene_type:complete